MDEGDEMNWKFWEKLKKIDLGAIPGQRWHIKKRGKDGRLIPIETVNKPPTENDMAMHGTGTYIIFTVKPKFQKYNSIIVAPPLNSLNQKKTKDSKRIISSSNQHTTGKTNNQQSQNKQKISDEYKHTLVQTQVPEAPEIPIKKDTIIEERPSQLIQVQPSHWDKFKEMWNQCLDCAYCKDIILVKGSEKQCVFCKQFFHNRCLSSHECSKSFICASCEKQVFIDSAYIVEYCGEHFCSPQCIDICMRKNKWKEKCRICKGSKDYDMVGNEENNEDICGYCEATLDIQEDIFECKDCNVIFCSHRCRRKYHLDQGEKHEFS